MTPQERRMVEQLFDRLAALESSERDAEAMRAIGDGLQRAPNALYPLVQIVLVQDEALKRAEARIRELEDELGIEPAAASPGFLDGMRDNLLGRREQQGSVPTVRPGAGTTISSAWRTTRLPQADAPPPQGPAPSGGSFLGGAASTAMGVMGGTMLMSGLRGLFGGQHGQAPAAQSPHSNPASPWATNAGGGDLARQAGIGDIGSSGGTSQPGGESSQRAGLFNTAKNEADDDDDSDDDFDFDGDDTA